MGNLGGQASEQVALPFGWIPCFSRVVEIHGRGFPILLIEARLRVSRQDNQRLRRR